MKTSKLLKLAKAQLAKNYLEEESYKSTYICFAIQRAAYREDQHSLAIQVRDIIQERLEPQDCLEEWLNVNHGVEEHNGYDSTDEEFAAYRDKIQATRHAWVDSMIAEFAAKGD